MVHKKLYKYLDQSDNSDYEIYLQTAKLLACQKKIDKLCNDDELQFQIVHQCEELLLKLITYTLINIVKHMEQKNTHRIITLFKRVHRTQHMLLDLFSLLETMSPKEYQQIRLALGNGSGQGSPGFRGLIHIIEPLWNEYQTQYLQKDNLSIQMIYNSSYQHDDAYVIAEALLEFDALYRRFYKHHFDLIERTIGGKAKSLKGHDVERLKNRSDAKLFPELWEIRNQMTDEWGQVYGSVRKSILEPANDSVIPEFSESEKLKPAVNQSQNETPTCPFGFSQKSKEDK